MAAMLPVLLKLLNKAARGASHLGMCLFFAVGPLSLSQPSVLDWPSTRPTVAGSDTILDYRLSPDARMILGTGSHSDEVLIHLPAVKRKGVPELSGMHRQGAVIEVFLGWFYPEAEEGIHIEIFRGVPGAEATFIRDLTLMGGPYWRVGFFQPPDGRDTPKVLIETYAGSTYWTTYLLAPDRQSAEELFGASGYEFADLDGDGIYELIASDGRWSDSSWCLDLFGFSFYPRIYVRDADRYQMAWPPSGGANFRVAAVHDLSGDGVAELVVLQDRVGGNPAGAAGVYGSGVKPTTPALAIYRLDQKLFRLVAQAPLPAGRIAFPSIGFRNSFDGMEIRVRTVPPAAVQITNPTGAPAECNPEGPGTAEAAYTFHASRLDPGKP